MRDCVTNRQTDRQTDNFQVYIYRLVMGRIGKKSGSGGCRILKIRVWVYRVLEKSDSGGYEKSQVQPGNGNRIQVLDTGCVKKIDTLTNFIISQLPLIMTK